jgi:hypothetical protein
LYRSGEKICGFACDGIILSGVMARNAIDAFFLALLMCLLAEKGKIIANHL